MKDHTESGLLMFAAWVGASLYFAQGATGFWGIVVAILKGLVWPAYAVFYGLRALHAA